MSDSMQTQDTAAGEESSSGIENRRDSDILLEGSVVGGRFTIKRHLAAGGMGRVYVAEQAPLGRPVALKVMHRDLCQYKDTVARFFREATAVTKLDHPNTIKVYDFGESTDGNYYIAMELLDGEPLNQRMHGDDPLSVEDCISIVLQVARSLAEAHRKGIIHRDLKPENIFLGNIERNFVKVLDFGIAKILEQDSAAKLTREGLVCGTAEYMSPEQACGQPLTGASDLYALGVVMYELLSGKVPFSENTVLATLLKHQTAPVPPLPDSVPKPLAEFITTRAMAKAATDRPATAEEFLAELEHAAADSGLRLESTATLPLSEYRHSMELRLSGEREAAQKQRSSRNMLVGLVIAALLVGGGVAVGLMLFPAPAATPDSAASPSAEQDKEQPEPAPVMDPAVPLKGTAFARHTVNIDSNPVGALISQGDTQYGFTPQTGIPVEAGVATQFLLSLEGHESTAVNVFVPADEQAPSTRELKAELARLLNVPIRSEPAGAEVFLQNGGELLRLGVADGSLRHRFRAGQEAVLLFSLAGHEKQTLSLSPADETEVLAVLKKDVKRVRPDEPKPKPKPDEPDEPKPKPGACSGGKTNCEGSCVDLNVDKGNCGRCGNACKSSYECKSGECKARIFDG